MTARKPHTSAVQVPEVVTPQWCARIAATMLLEAMSPLADSDQRDRILPIAAEWRALADVLRED